MSLIITKQKQIEEYFNSEYISQSTLKKLTQGLQNYRPNTSSIGRHFNIGSAVDLLLTGEDGDFDRAYQVVDLSVSQAQKDLLEQIYGRVISFGYDISDKKLAFFRELVSEILEESTWRANLKLDTRVNKLINEGSEYFEVMKDSRQIINSSDYRKIINTYQSLKSYDPLFNRSKLRVEDSTTYYQLPIYFEYKELKCKALLDVLKINCKGNHLTATITDIKTTSEHVLNFYHIVKKFRYDIQAAFYVEAVKYWIKNTLKWEGESTVEFQFIVETVEKQLDKRIFKADKDFLDRGKYGVYPVELHGVQISSEVKGFEELINEYKYFSECEWKLENYLKEEINLGANGLII